MKTIAKTTAKIAAKTPAGDVVVLVPGPYDEVCSARCEGCGWLNPRKGSVALVADVRRLAREHARECVGDQGTLF